LIRGVRAQKEREQAGAQLLFEPRTLLCVVVLWISSSFADQNMRESHRRPVIVKVPGKLAVA
jgi:hypothetical protein